MRYTWRSAVLSALLVASCSGSDGTSGTTSGPTSTGAPTTTLAATTTSPQESPSTTQADSGPSPIITDTVLAYFEAFARNDEGRQAMLEHSREGSAAHAYATFWWALWLAAGPSAGFEQDIDASEPGEIAACIPPGQETSLDSGCVAYTDFVRDEATGLLVDFEEAGKPMSESVALGDGTVDTADGISIRIVVAKRTTAELITVIWETSNETGSVGEGEVRLVTADGEIIQNRGWTQNDVPAGESVLNAVHFMVPELGGVLQYRIESTGSIIEVPIPTP